MFFPCISLIKTLPLSNSRYDFLFSFFLYIYIYIYIYIHTHIWGIKSWQLFFLPRLNNHDETWKCNKWKWMVFGDLGYMNNTDFEKQIVNDYIVLDVFITCQKLRHVQVI